MHACMTCLLILWGLLHCNILAASRAQEICTRDVQNDHILYCGLAVLQEELAWLLLRWPAVASVARLSAWTKHVPY